MANQFEKSKKLRGSALFNDEERIFGTHPLVSPALGVPKFGDRKYWNLAAADQSPSAGVAELGIDFQTYSGEWNLRAREVAMILLNPNHPRLISLGLSGNRRLPKVLSVVSMMRSFRHVYRWAVKAGAPSDLRLWTPAHAREFLESSLSERAPSTVHKEVAAFRLLHTYRNALTDGGVLAPPWPSHLSNAGIAGYRVGGTLLTKPLSPQEWASVVNAAWTYIDKFEPDIRSARERIRAPNLDKRISPRRVRELVQAWLSEEGRRIPLAEQPYGQRAQGDIDYQRILVEATGFRGKQVKSLFGKVLQTQIEEKVRAGDTTGAVNVTYKVTDPSGKQRLWRPPIETTYDLQAEETRLRTAGYILISSLTLMRNSEIQGIRRNSVVTHHGSPAIKSKVVKHNWTQEERYWWAADAVLKAVSVLEAQHTGPWLFSVFRAFSPDRDTQPPRLLMLYDIQNFIKHVNANHQQWGIDPIDTVVNARRLRRTMAIIAGGGVDGPIAVALQLKHATRYAVANQLSSAYAAPDAAWTKVFVQAQHEATATFLRNLGEQARENPNLRPSGPGADRALSAAQHLGETFFPGVVDDGSIAKTLQEVGVGSLQEGPISYCLGDPQAALCLSNEEKARGDSPNPVKCQPDRCTNSFVTTKQQKELTVELNHLRKQESRASSTHSATVLKERISELERLLQEGAEHESGKR